MENRFLFPAQSLVIFSWRGDEGSRTLIVRFTRPTLCYPLELHRHLKLVDWEGVKPSQEVCRTSMLSVTSPARKSGGCGWIRTTNLALMRRLLCRLSYTARNCFEFQVQSFKFDIRNLRLETCNLKLMIGSPR